METGVSEPVGCPGLSLKPALPQRLSDSHLCVLGTLPLIPPLLSHMLCFTLTADGGHRKNPKPDPFWLPNPGQRPLSALTLGDLGSDSVSMHRIGCKRGKLTVNRGPWGLYSLGTLWRRGLGVGSWESSLYNLYTIKGQYDRLVEIPPEVRPGRRDEVDGEDFWAGEGSLKDFHVGGEQPVLKPACRNLSVLLQKRLQHLSPGCLPFALDSFFSSRGMSELGSVLHCHKLRANVLDEASDAQRS